MLYSYTSSESQLFMVNMETYSQRCSHTYICENMQSDRADCNQTLAKHKHCHSFCCAPKPPHSAPHTHKGSGPVHKNWSFYQREPRQQKKGENDCMLFTKHALRYTRSKKCQSKMNISIGCVDHRQCREQNGTCKSST